MSRDYRDKLAVLCDLIKSGGNMATDVSPQKRASIRKMCYKLRESQRQSASSDPGEPGGSGGLFTILVVCAAGYYFFIRAQPQAAADNGTRRTETRPRPAPAPGGGGTLGGSSSNLTPQQLREARLQKFAAAAAATGGGSGGGG